MGMPELTHDEFGELHGDLAPRPFLLQSIDAEAIYTQVEASGKGLRVYFLGVKEPHMYVTKDAKRALVMPAKGVDYDDLSAVFPEHDAWAYSIVEEVDEDLEDRDFFFRDGSDMLDGKRKIAPFELGKVSTH